MLACHLMRLIAPSCMLLLLLPGCPGSGRHPPRSEPGPLFAEQPDDFVVGLKIPPGYPMKSIVDLTFGYGDDPPPRARCFAAIPARQVGISVCTGMQGGIFRVAARAAPEVAGHAWLRAVEPIRNRVLSEEDLRTRTRRPLASSSAGDLVEYYVENAMIKEGDWNDWYPARFELWFKPTGGIGTRKLCEDVFLINGWQR